MSVKLVFHVIVVGFVGFLAWEWWTSLGVFFRLLLCVGTTVQ